MLPEGHPAVATGGQRRMRQSYRYPNGSVIVVGGLDKPGKVMSTEYDAIYVQEAIELSEDAWEALTTRLRHGRLPYQQLLADTNPDRPTHWLKKRCDAGTTVLLESRHEDNPLLWDAPAGDWTDGGRVYLSKLDALTGPRKQRLRFGRWVQAEGVVYEGWDAAIHLIDRFPIPADWPRYWSIDFGYNNPFVCQFWAVDPDGRLYLYREFYRTGKLVQDAALELLRVVGALQPGAASPDWSRASEPRPREVLCDHDAEDQATLDRHLKMTTRKAFKDVSPGIQAVAARLRKAGDGRPRLFVLRDARMHRPDPALVEAKKPTCTAEEIDGYVWDTGNRRKDGEAPLKVDDHGMDAMRYQVAALDLNRKKEFFAIF